MPDAATDSNALSAGIARRSPLHGVIRQGRHGAHGAGTPGLHLALVHPVSIVTVIARKGKAGALDAAMKKQFGLVCPGPGKSTDAGGMSLRWAGPYQWLAISASGPEGHLFDQLHDGLDGLASVSDQSHGRVLLSVDGPRARDVLAKGTPVDLHPSAFASGDTALTQMAHVGVHLTRTGEDQFELSLFRGFAESFWEWLTEMSLEYGYEAG